MNHLTFEEISELAESRAPRAESRPSTGDGRAPSAERHLAECRDCRETLHRVQALMVATRALPRDVAPPADLWDVLRSRVGREQTAARSRRRAWRVGWLATAAAVVLIVGTAVLLPRGAGKAKAGKPPSSNAAAVVLVAFERQYGASIAELRQTLQHERASLSPATVEVVERSLAIIDAAIAEAAQALASDPGSGALRDILAAQYEAKLELLQRAAKLSASL